MLTDSSHGTRPGVLLAVSLKMYFGVDATRRWVEEFAGVARGLGPEAGVELAVLPTFPLLESTAAALAGTGATWGGQDVAASDNGNQTGEVSAATLAELGCRYVEVGHSERRRGFAETDLVVREKVRRVVEHGMCPLLCVGEPAEGPAEPAAAWCVRQLDSATEGLAPGTDLVVAYEPVWAIGATHPADPAHVRAVCRDLRSEVARRGLAARVVYGGSAGPGTLAALAPDAEGLFLGRFVHDIAMLAQVVKEVTTTSITTAAPRG